jgi:hypothetical protein
MTVASLRPRSSVGLSVGFNVCGIRLGPPSPYSPLTAFGLWGCSVLGPALGAERRPMASTRAPLARFETASVARIYRIPVETFPGQVNNIYLILDRRQAGTSTLVNVGYRRPAS